MYRRAPTYIRRARRSKGLTQAELGVLLGYKENTILCFESGKRPPTLKFVLGCAWVFEQSIAELFPNLHNSLVEDIETNAAKLDTRLTGRTDPATRKIAALLKSISERAEPISLV
jgi:transcriptional regulator with XRE-family HTH domain